MSLTGMLLAACAAHGDRVAVVDDDGEHTYAQLDEASARIARGLGARGVGPGDAVGLLAPRGW
ncbi:AMP-binding protein, partial [Streptomyces sp. CO7]